MKKVLTLVLALCMLCGTALAGGYDINTIEGSNAALGFPVCDTPIAVTIGLQPQGASIDFKPENNWVCQYLERYSGLDITWLMIDPSVAQERVAMMLNSGDLPDAIIGHTFSVNDITQYGVSEGLFYPINELMEYLPTFEAAVLSDPQARAEITAPDGNIYGFPGMSNIWSNDSRFFIMEDWLKRVGKENPTTLEQFKDVLIAFRDNDANGNGDPNDEIPFGGSWSEGFSERQMMFRHFGYITDGANIAIDYNKEDPDIVFMAYTEDYKNYLKYMNDLWNEKLIDPDIFTKASTQVAADILDDKVGIVSMSAPNADDKARELQWRVLNPISRDESVRAIYPGVNKVSYTSLMTLSADCDEEKAIALAKLADSMYTLEWYRYACRGPEIGTELDWNNNGHYADLTTRTMQIECADDMPSLWNHICTYTTIWMLPGFNTTGYDDYLIRYGQEYPDTEYGKCYANGPAYSPWNEEMNALYAPYYKAKVPNFFFSDEDLERLNALTVPLDDYVASMEAKFITGEISIDDEFANFTTTLESYGVQELVELYNTYYTAYKAN